MPLRRARHVQSAAHGEILAVEPRRVEAAGPQEPAVRLVADEGAVVPGVPQKSAGLDELLGHGIALGMRRMLAAEHRARLGVGGRHDIPAGPTGREVVERGEAAGHVIGLGVGRRGGGGEAQPRGAHRESRKQRQRLELADCGGMLAISRGEAVAQEEHIELPALGSGRDVLHQAEVGPAIGHGIGVPPAGDVMARRLDENAETHFSCQIVHRGRLLRGKRMLWYIAGRRGESDEESFRAPRIMASRAGL